jgi:protein SCO1/2
VVRAVLAVLMVLALTACGSGEGPGPAVTGVKISDDDGYHGIYLDKAYAVPDERLVDTSGKPFELGTRPRRTLVFFGYTNCPDICQVVMSTLASAVAKLTPEQRREVQVAFVTTDPARDTRKVLRRYLDRYNKDFVGVTGPLKSIVALGKPMGIDVLKGQKLASGGYEVEHTTNVIAVRGGQGDLVWTASTSPTDVADDLKKILEADA